MRRLDDLRRWVGQVQVKTGRPVRSISLAGSVLREICQDPEVRTVERLEDLLQVERGTIEVDGKDAVTPEPRRPAWGEEMRALRQGQPSPKRLAANRAKAKAARKARRRSRG